MGRKGARRYLIIIISCVLFISMLTSPNVSGNPIPMRVFHDSRSGGTPLPGSSDINNFTVFLMEERITARIRGDYADIEAEYTFFDHDPQDNEMEICLPFVNKPWDVGAAMYGYDIPYSWSRIDYDPLSDHCIDWEYFPGTLSCIVFNIPVTANAPTTVLVNYKSEVSIYDSSLNSEIMYWFSYLVGSGRYWNHSITEATFEYIIPIKLYDRGAGDQWTKYRDGNDHVFTKQYHNWTPEQDFIGISWERDRGIMEEVERIFENAWNDPNERPFIMGCCGILIVISLIPILIIYKYLKKKRKKHMIHEGSKE